MKLSRNALVAIDTQILIYAFRDKYQTPEQKADSRLAKALLKTLNQKRVRLCISAITVAEYLAGVAEDQKPMLLRQFSTTFEIAVFNLQAATIAARLVEPAKLLVQGDRQILIADTKIIGSLIAYKCSVFFTNDLKLRKLSAGHIAVGELATQLEFELD